MQRIKNTRLLCLKGLSIIIASKDPRVKLGPDNKTILILIKHIN